MEARVITVIRCPNQIRQILQSKDIKLLETNLTRIKVFIQPHLLSRLMMKIQVLLIQVNTQSHQLHKMDKVIHLFIREASQAV